MTVRLRAHHLLCLLTYVGKGYDAQFCAGYDRVVERLAAGEAIVIVDGPDDLCAPLLHHDDPHCLRPGVEARDRSAAAAVGELLGRSLEAGSRFSLSAETLLTMRAAFARSTTRTACDGCEWHALCTTIASEGFAGVRLEVEPH
jgi:hypothetical protein